MIRPLYTAQDEQEDTEDQAVPLSKAHRLFDSKPSIPSLHRWRTAGLINHHGERVRLEMVRIAGRWYVRPSAAREFLAACNAVPATATAAPKGAASAALVAMGY